MADSASRLVADILSGTLRLLDIPADMQAAAEATYDDVGLWLGDHLESNDHWDVYAQGSMRLGTVVRPSENDEYDIDAVVQCNIAKEETTQADLRNCVGDALKAYVKAKAGDDKVPTACEPGKRCWTLTFEQPFHIDVLPAIPDPLASPTGIQLTDARTPGGSGRTRSSSPGGSTASPARRRCCATRWPRACRSTSRTYPSGT